MSERAFTLEDVNAIIAAIQAGKGGGRKRRVIYSNVKRSKATPEESELRRKANDEECFRKFTALGYTDVRPRINVLTFGKWAEKGRQVRKGEKGTQVGPFNLFHEDQTDPISSPAVAAIATPPEVKAAIEEAAKVAEATKPTSSSWTDWNS